MEWDTKFFGRAIGEMLLSPGEKVTQNFISSLDYDYLITRVDASNLKLIQSLEQLGFITEDWSYIFHKKITGFERATGVRPAREDDLPVVKEYCRGLFVNSRFYKSPYVTIEEADRLHETWIENLWHHQADAVLVFELDGYPSGFIGLKGEFIQLTGVNPRHQKRGIGRSLVHGALNWFLEHGVTVAKVKTQVNNLPAVSLYVNAGFSPIKCEATLSIGKEMKK